MNEVWDLSILYKDFDDPAFTGDMKDWTRPLRR